MQTFIKNLGGTKAIIARILFVIVAVSMTSMSIVAPKLTKTQKQEEPVETTVPTTIMETTTEEETTEETTTANKNVTFSVSSLKKDIRIRIYDCNKELVKGITFDIKITDSKGKVTNAKVEGSTKLTNIEPGKYTVELVPAGDYIFNTTKKEVTVKAVAEAKVVDVDVSKGTQESSKMGEEKSNKLKNTVTFVESSSKVVKKWVEVPYADIKDPYADPSASLKDTDKNQLYVKNGDNYVAAKNSDYSASTTFYTKSEDTSGEEPIITYNPVDSSKVKDPNAGVKTTDKLKDNDGDQVYLSKDTTSPATVANYDKSTKYYKEVEETLYTGWQVINGNHYFYKSDNTYVTGTQVIQGVSYNFSDTGKLMGKMGCDISYHNGKVDFNKMKKAGIEFVIIRCGYRGYGSEGNIKEDTQFKNNIYGARAAGLQIGIYFFSTALNDEEAIEEASAAVQLLKKYGVNKTDFPIFYDFEGYNNEKYRTYGKTTQASRTSAALAFCKTITSAGYKAGVYGSKYYMSPGSNAKFDVTKFEGKYTIWIAQYNTKITYKRHYDMWQNTSTADGKTYGVSSQYIDLNYSYM